MKALLIESDDRIRRAAASVLENMDCTVEAFTTAEAGLAATAEAEPRLVLCGWNVGDMHGLDLIRALRDLTAEGAYTYLLVLGDLDQEFEIAALESGANDIVSTPIIPGVLRARLSAGARIIRLNDENQQIYRDLQGTYESIQADLSAAVEVQQQLLPKTPRVIENIRFDSMYVPAARVAGDTLGFHWEDQDHIAFYHIDVSGHGIQAALLSVTLSFMIKPSFDRPDALGGVQLPHDVVADLQRRFYSEDSTQYFTMVQGRLNCRSGEVRFCQAGHPTPIIVRKSGEIERVGNGGFPVALVPGAEFESESAFLDRGDRLFLYSDGITECENPDQEQFDERLDRFLSANHNASTNRLLSLLEGELTDWHGSDVFDDDVSALMLQII